MDLKQIRAKFKAGSWLKKIVGAKTYSTIQDVTEHIFYKLEGLDRDVVSLENKIAQLESDVKALEQNVYD